MRISIASLNLWNTEHLDKRLPALRSFLSTYDADIFLFQEIRDELIDEFKDVLKEHDYIIGDDLGWRQESNIFYKRDMFTLLDFGRIDLDMPEKDRGAFWVKLQDKRDNKIFFASTIHLTWQGNADEVRTGLPYRHREAHDIVKKFPPIFKDNPVFIAGDFNDPLHPGRILSEAGFKDVFTLLHEPHPLTFPCLGLTDEEYLAEGIDKLMVIGFKPLMACSPHFYIPGSTLSDHYPLVAMLEL